MRTKFWMEA